MSSSRSSCSEIDMTIDLSAMISATMSRISSRAASCSMVASWLRSMESIRALKIADLVWKYSLSRAIASAERTSTMSSLRRRLTAASITGRGTSARTAGGVAWTAVAAGGGLACGRGASAAPGVLPPDGWRLPNIAGHRELQERRELEATALADGLRRRAAGDVHTDGAEDVVGTIVGCHLGEHLAVVGGGAEGRGIEADLAEQLALDRGRELLGSDLRALGDTELVDDQQRLGLARPQRL